MQISLRRRWGAALTVAAVLVATVIGQAVDTPPARAAYGAMIHPVSGYVQYLYAGSAAVCGRSDHDGVDINGNANSIVVAAAGGTVRVAGDYYGYGRTVIIDHPGGYNTLYGHLRTGSIAVQAGAHVEQGQELGRVGNTGQSFGDHLHFWIKRGTENITNQGFDCHATVTGGTPIPMDFPGLGDTSPQPPAPVFDDFAIYRNVDGYGLWTSKAGPTGAAYQFADVHHGGWAQDRPLAGDFDHDGIDELVIYRPVDGTGRWYAKKPDGTVTLDGAVHGGWAQDVPVIGNFDGYGDRLGIYRNIDGVGHWYAKTVDGAWVLDVVHGGWGQDVPLVGDFDGDGRDDLVIYRAIDGTGHWYVKRNDGSWVVNDFLHGGWPHDVPVVGDFNNDGVDDFGIYRAIDGTARWYVKSGVDGSMIVDGVVHGGWVQDIPVVGNFG